MKIAVDASSLLAILFGEADAEAQLAKLLTATAALISPMNWWEVQVRMRSLYGEPGEQHAAAWMESMRIEVEPVTASQAAIAVEAFARYRGRPAQLNMGDCFAYALAKSKSVPLLYKGGEFAGTDITTY